MKPNIIIIMTDQQRTDLRKSCGYSLDTMPFLDQWAKEGVDFDLAYTSNPTCMPARVSLFTGRYPTSHHVRTNHNAEDAYFTKDLLDILKEQGYRTALCGKNHSHRHYKEFDFYRGNGHAGNEEGEDRTPEESAFSHWINHLEHMESHEPSPGGLEVQHPYRNVDSTLEFIDEIKKGDAPETPFFIWLSFAEPHSPYQVPEPYFDMFAPQKLPPLNTGASDLAAKGPRYQWLRECWEEVLDGAVDERIPRVRSNYHGMLKLLDDQLKRLIEGLDERKLTENTIVIYLSDHGDFAGEYGLIRKGADLPEVLTHIPMIWKGPGIVPQGKCTRAFVNIVDVLPTICDLLGIMAPEGCQGKSMVPLLQNREIPENEFDTAYVENGFSGRYWEKEDDLSPVMEGAMGKDPVFFDCLNTWSQSGQVRMIRKGSCKLQIDMMGKGYLYDLKEDPKELNDLWEDKSYAAMKTELLELLVREMLRFCDTLPYPRNRYRVKVHPKGYWEQTYICKDPGVKQKPER